MAQETTAPVEQQTEWQGYSIIFAILAIFTIFEVATAYLSGLPVALRTGLLVVLAIIKAVLVLLYFMRLRFDNRLFALPFAFGAVLVVPLILIIGLTTTPPIPTAAANSLSVDGNIVDVTLRSYIIDLSTDHVPSGQVTFHITNQATDMMHEFIVIKTDKPSDQLPTNEIGHVKEEAINIIDSREDIFFGTTVNMQLNLKPGHYVFICNLPEHYQAGMNVGFTVDGTPDAEATSAATAESTSEATIESTSEATSEVTATATP